MTRASNELDDFFALDIPARSGREMRSRIYEKNDIMSFLRTKTLLATLIGCALAAQSLFADDSVGGTNAPRATISTITPENVGYAIGMSVGMNITNDMKRLNFDANKEQIMQGFRDALFGNDLKFTPQQVGTLPLNLRLSTAAGEYSQENNQRSFVLRVIRDRVRVLLVAGRPSWDERFLRGLLKQDPNVDLVSFFILRTATDNAGPQDQLSLIPFPVAEIFGPQLRTFDAVVFVNFDYRPYRALDIERFLPALRDYVRGGGAFAMVGGEQSFGEGHYGATPLAEVLPVEVVEGLGLAEEEFRPRLTPEGRRHPVTSLAGALKLTIPPAHSPAIRAVESVGRRSRPAARSLSAAGRWPDEGRSARRHGGAVADSPALPEKNGCAGLRRSSHLRQADERYV